MSTQGSKTMLHVQMADQQGSGMLRKYMQTSVKKLKIAYKDAPGGTRTHNPQIRSLVRYPLRHGSIIIFRTSLVYKS